MSEKLKALVHTVRHEARGIISVELRPLSEAERFPPFEAGAHIDLYLPDGLTRSYSLCELDDDGGRYVIGVLNDRASRGGSRYVHERLRVGSELTISHPRNHFRLIEDAPRIILIAGGIGITPIFAMLQRLGQLGREPETIYCARTRSEAAFVERVTQLAGKQHINLHFDDEQGGPPNLHAMLAGYDRDAHLYCCGPTPMLDAYEQVCAELGFANAHLERFAPAARPGTIAVDGQFEVELARSGQRLQIPPNKSILQVLLEAGVDVDYSCEEGICGSCEIRVMKGEVDHRDGILTEAERAVNDTMMICVSRCKGARLVLDK